jgi:hypothetical protein
MFIAALADCADPATGAKMIAWMAEQGRSDREQMDFCDPYDAHLLPVPGRVDREPPGAYV